MCVKRIIKTIVGAFLALLFLTTAWAQAADVVINTETTWSDASGFADADTVTVNNNIWLTVDGDAATKTISTLTLGKTTTTPAGDGTGSLWIKEGGELKATSFVLGDENKGTLSLQSGSTFTVDNITFNKGRVYTEGIQIWSVKPVTWNNTTADEIEFLGSSTGAIHIGTKASGEKLTLSSGTLTTTGDLDASGFVLSGGTLQVDGALTYTGQLVAGSTIELLTGSTWTTTGDQSPGNIIVAGGTLTLGEGQDFATGGGSLSMSSGVVELNGFNLDLGNANASVVTGGHFASSSLGSDTVSWNTGTVKGSVKTFFNSNYYEDNANVAVSGDGVLEVYNDSTGSYSVTYDFSLSDTATVVGEDMLLYVQAAGSITSTSGTNTANFQFMGRNEKSTTIDSGATFEGDIEIKNGVFNKVKNGIFNGEMKFSNPGDTATGVADVPVGVGVIEISGGTFNDLLTLDLSVRTDVTPDTENKANISGGTFNAAVSIDGDGASLISGGTFNDAVSMTGSGIRTISGGSLMNNVSISGDVTQTGGTLAGTVSIGGNVTQTGGILGGNATIGGSVIQTGGTISPGNSIGTVDITGDLNMTDAEIEIGPNGTCDTIVVGGQTTLADGGKMTIKPISQETRFSHGDQYSVIQSTGEITGSGYLVNSEIGGFDASGAIVGNEYVITLDRSIHYFPAGAHNANNLANYLYDLSDSGEHHNEVMLAITSAPNQQIAAETLSGESHMTGVQALMNTGIIRLQTLTERIRPGMASRVFSDGFVDNQEVIARGQFDPHAEFEHVNVWYAGYGMGGHIVGDANTASSIVSFSGMMVGVEGIYSCGASKVGVFYDRSNVRTGVDPLDAKNNVNTNFFGGYLTNEMENGYRLFTFGFGEDRYTSRRNLLIAPGTANELNEVAKSGYHGWQSTFYAERGFDSLGSMSRIQPYAGLQYSYIRRNSFDETDATYAALDMEAINYDSLRSYLGARWNTPFIEIGHHLRSGQPVGGLFQFQAAWIHEMLDKTAPIGNAQLGSSGLSNNFLVEGADCGRDWCMLSMGTKWRLTKSFSFYGDYTMLVNTRQTFHTGSGGLSLSW